MIGYLKVVDRNKKEVLHYYKYSSLNDVQKKLLKDNPNIILLCACNDNNLEVKIASDLRVYPANQLVGHLHSKNCPRHIDFVPTKLWTKQVTETNIYYNVANSEATVKDFFEKINGLTHYRLTKPENRMPDNHKDFNKKAYITTKYIKTADDEILYDISVLNNRNISDISPFRPLFIYGELIKIVKTEFDENTSYVDIMDCFENRHRFYIDKQVLATTQKPGVYDPKATYICGGFVYKKKQQSKILTFSEFYIAKINELGLLEITEEKTHEKQRTIY